MWKRIRGRKNGRGRNRYFYGDKCAVIYAVVDGGSSLVVELQPLVHVSDTKAKGSVVVRKSGIH